MKRTGSEEFEFARLLSFVISFINPRYGPHEKVICVIKELPRFLRFLGSFINPRYGIIYKYIKATYRLYLEYVYNTELA